MGHCYQYEYQVFQVQTLLVKFYLFFFLTLTNVTIHLFMVIVTFFPLDPIVRNLKRKKKSTWIERTQREREDLKFFWKLQNSSCWSQRILLQCYIHWRYHQNLLCSQRYQPTASSDLVVDLASVSGIWFWVFIMKNRHTILWKCFETSISTVLVSTTYQVLRVKYLFYMRFLITEKYSAKLSPQIWFSVYCLVTGRQYPFTVSTDYIPYE